MKTAYLFVLSLFFALSSVVAQNIVTLKKGENLSAKSEELITIFQKVPILEGVKDMKNFELIDIKNSKFQYVAGEGITKEGNTIAFRVQVTVTNTTTEMRIDLGGAGGHFFAESCTGVNCSKCRFAKTGGCECERTVKGHDGYCNHNISK